nr:hypothetical protein CFP56_34735 [Quercus suber]
MPSRPSPHDPFYTAALPETSLRGQPSQQSLRSNTSTASTRNTRQRQVRSGGGAGNDNLFAPSLSRRPTGRATPRIDDDVLADSPDSDDELHGDHRRGRNGSPVKGKQTPTAAGDIVNRRENGNYFLDSGGDRPHGFPAVTAEAQQELDQAGCKVLLHLRTSYGRAACEETGRRYEGGVHDLCCEPTADEVCLTEFEAMTAPMLLRLREQAMQKIEGERWLFESSSRHG